MAHSGYLIVPIRVSLCNPKKNTEKQQQTDTDSSSYTSLNSRIDSSNSSICSSTDVSPNSSTNSSPCSRRCKSVLIDTSLIDTSLIDTSYGYGYGKASQVWCGFHNKNR